MSLVPAFELGLWNAWIFEVLWIISMFLGYLIDKKAMKRFGVVPPYGKTVKNLFLIAKLMSMVIIVYSIFLPIKLGTIWFYAGLPIYSLGLVMSLMVAVNFAQPHPMNQLPKEFTVFQETLHTLACS